MCKWVYVLGRSLQRKHWTSRCGAFSAVASAQQPPPLYFHLLHAYNTNRYESHSSLLKCTGWRYLWVTLVLQHLWLTRNCMWKLQDVTSRLPEAVVCGFGASRGRRGAKPLASRRFRSWYVYQYRLSSPLHLSNYATLATLAHIIF